MLKERHRYGVRACGSSRGAPLIAPPQVGIIPGNRFLLLPLKKVSVLVRHHGYPICRGASATSIKTCIQSKPPSNRASNMTATHTTTTTTTNTLRSPSNRSIARPIRRRHRQQQQQQPAVAKTHLGTISEQDEGTKPLLDDPGNGPWKQGTGHVARIRKQNLERAENARRINTHLYFRKAGRQENSSGTSIFTLEQPLDDFLIQRRRPRAPASKMRLNAEREFVSELVETALKHEEVMVSNPNGKRTVRNLVAFGRNRVSPSEHGGVVYPETSLDRLEDASRTRRVRVSRRGGERDESFGGCSRDRVDQPRRATWRSTFVCSLADARDLPIGPLHRGSLKELLLK